MSGRFAHDPSKGQRLVDINTFVGAYPFRHVPHPEPAALVAVMKREGVAHSLVGYLPAPWQRSAAESNKHLFELLRPHSEFLSPLPVVNPSWPGWERDLAALADEEIVGIRIYPPQWGQAGRSNDLRALAGECVALKLTMVLTTRFEDSRQRHWMDNAGDVSAPVVRDIVRCNDGGRVVLTCAGRSLIEEIHWSLTPAERMRIWYDISWIWGPPQNDLAHLLTTIGPDRFLFGSMWPLRLVQTPFANMELLPGDMPATQLGTARAAFPLFAAPAG